MRTVTDLSALERGKRTVLTIGAFDGVHRGHQYLIRQVMERAKEPPHGSPGRSMVLTFDPRPQVVLRPGSVQLTNEAEKERIIRAIGPDVLVVLPFTRELSAVPAGAFVDSILAGVDLAEIWVGADFAFGHNREGNVDFLIRRGQEDGFAVHVIERKGLHGEPISSTRARDLFAAGDIRGAVEMLGHYPSLPGTVVGGIDRGVTLGYPTANVEPPPAQLLPAVGIYAAFMRCNGDILPAAVSVGYNATFGGERVVVEAFVLDFSGELRGEDVALDFVARISDEEKFDEIPDLVKKIGRDVDRTREILAAAADTAGKVLLP